MHLLSRAGGQHESKPPDLFGLHHLLERQNDNPRVVHPGSQPGPVDTGIVANVARLEHAPDAGGNSQVFLVGALDVPEILRVHNIATSEHDPGHHLA